MPAFIKYCLYIFFHLKFAFINFNKFRDKIYFTYKYNFYNSIVQNLQNNNIFTAFSVISAFMILVVLYNKKSN